MVLLLPGAKVLRSKSSIILSNTLATIPSRLDGTVAVVNTISFSLSVTRLVLTPALFYFYKGLY